MEEQKTVERKTLIRIGTKLKKKQLRNLNRILLTTEDARGGQSTHTVFNAVKISPLPAFVSVDTVPCKKKVVLQCTRSHE